MSSLSLRRSLCLALTLCLPAAVLSTTASQAAAAPVPSRAVAAAPSQAAPVQADAAGVAPSVVTYELDGVDADARTRLGRKSADVAALTAPERVDGFATVGLSWDPRGSLGDATLWVRTYDDVWSPWQQAETEAEDAPDAGSAEALGQRPGTAPLVVGEVEQVQAKAVSRSGVLPDGLALAVIDPGTASGDDVRTPAFGAAAGVAFGAVRAGTTPAPAIFTRQQWGADESLRDGSPSYGSVQATVVHHTVNANDYTRESVPAIVRSIYAYHTQVNGWSDIGYNVLVDRFGRLWEGRYGGLSRAVVGAHTLNYNEETFGISAIGNFETAQPPARMQDAIARTLAWKLDRAGKGTVGAAQVGGEDIRLVNGHRDLGSTACPGRYLYARLPAIRELAAGYQAEGPAPAPGGASLRRSIDRDDHPDVVVRHGGRLQTLLGDDGPGFAPPVGSGALARDFDVVTGLGDVDGDGQGDLLVRHSSSGGFDIRAATGTAGAGALLNEGGARFATARALTGSPDLTGDGRPDLLVTTDTGEVKLASGREGAGFSVAQRLSRDWAEHRAVLGAGDLDSDSTGDLLLVDAAGVLWFAAGDDARNYAAPVRLGGGWRGRSGFSAGHDLTGDGVPDVLATTVAGGRTWIWPGDGNGSLGEPIGGWTGWGDARAVTTTADATGDGFADALVVDAAGRMTVRASNHGMWLRPDVHIAGAWSSYRWLALAGDWDGDGRGDLVGVEGDKLWLLRGRGNGRYHPRVGGWPGWRNRFHLTASDDWTGDGRPDLLSKQSDGSVWLHTGRGTRGTAEPRGLGSVGRVTAITAVGHWDRDQFPDLVTRAANGALKLRPGRGTKPLSEAVLLLGGRGYGRYDRILGAGDLTGDGRADLLARSAGPGEAWILPGSRQGVGQRVPVAGGWGSHTLIG